MINRLNKALSKIQISGIRQFNELANQYENVIKLTLGQPDFHVPESVKKASIDAVNNNLTTYTSNQGIIELRQGVSDYLNRKVNHKFSSDNIIITIGATGALSITLNSILNPGDEVILLSPTYPGYEPIVELNLGICKYFDTINGIDSLALKGHITGQSKAIIITSPNNPTGIVYSQDDFNILFDLALKHDLFIIWDAIYLDLIYENRKPIYIPNELRENMIIIGGFSKSHSMTGYRLGFLSAEKQLVCQLIKTQQYSVTCASSIAQQTGLKALTIDNQYMIDTYKERRDYLVKAFTDMNLPFVNPDGAFYMFIDVSSLGIGGESFALKLLETQKVACVPGKYFSGADDRFVRMSYSTSLEQLKEAVTRIEIFLKQQRPI